MLVPTWEREKPLTGCVTLMAFPSSPAPCILHACVHIHLFPTSFPAGYSGPFRDLAPALSALQDTCTAATPQQLSLNYFLLVSILCQNQEENVALRKGMRIGKRYQLGLFPPTFIN